MTAFAYRHITGAANDGLLHAGPIVLHGVVIGKAAAGQTLSLHDAESEAAAAAGNLISVLALDAVGSPVFGGVWCIRGLVAIVSAGAPDITVITG